MRRIALACLVVAATAGAATADTLADCGQARNAQTRLRACSEIIASPAYGGADKALAYRNRGNARADAGANAQAVADFDQAIRLRPNDASGYAGRARARLALRDVAGAIDDYERGPAHDARLGRPPCRSRPRALRQGRSCRRRLPTSRRRFGSIRTVRARSTGAASPTAGPATWRGPSTTTQRPSPSIPSTRSPTTTAATSTRRRAARTMRSPISRRRSCSIPR